MGSLPGEVLMLLELHSISLRVRPALNRESAPRGEVPRQRNAVGFIGCPRSLHVTARFCRWLARTLEGGVSEELQSVGAQLRVVGLIIREALPLEIRIPSDVPGFAR